MSSRRSSSANAGNLRPTELDDEIATFDPAEIAKSGAKRRNATCVTGRGHQTEETDTSNLSLLPPGRERPRRSGAEQRDELAPLQLTALHSLSLTQTPLHHNGLTTIE
jgi:hypothetical protein